MAQSGKIRETGMLTAIGLMSGTSADGIDAALIVSDGKRVVRQGAYVTTSYSEAARRDIKAAFRHAATLDPEGDPQILFAGIAEKLADWHGEAVHKLLEISGVMPYEIDIIGFHGQTILHRPDVRRTWQIGDAARLADITGIDVVADFRSADVAAGGEGAPLVPLYHAALVAGARAEGRLCGQEAVAILNLGGVGNVTWVGAGEDDILAFDTGPGNALIDDWMLAKTGIPCDSDGRAAARGKVDAGVIEALMGHGYFRRPPPKSLDRQTFTSNLCQRLSLADGAATLTDFTAHSVVAALPYFPTPPARWLVCGGGRHNLTLMKRLKELLQVSVEPVEVLGWQGDALEAEAFGFLAVRSLKGLPLSLPTTTGVPRPMPGGRLFKVI
jgi:anhydro-N-acetylmuramic acid kinase